MTLTIYENEMKSFVEIRFFFSYVIKNSRIYNDFQAAPIHL